MKTLKELGVKSENNEMVVSYGEIINGKYSEDFSSKYTCDEYDCSNNLWKLQHNEGWLEPSNWRIHKKRRIRVSINGSRFYDVNRICD